LLTDSDDSTAAPSDSYSLGEISILRGKVNKGKKEGSIQIKLDDDPPEIEAIDSIAFFPCFLPSDIRKTNTIMYEVSTGYIICLPTAVTEPALEAFAKTKVGKFLSSSSSSSSS